MEVKAIKPSKRASGGVIGEGGGLHEPHLPEAFGPFQDSGHVHADPNDPKSCQLITAQEEEGSGGPEGHPEGGRGHSDEKGGGLVGLGMSVLGVMAVGGLVGFGDVWPRGKFQSGTRQPGVR